MCSATSSSSSTGGASSGSSGSSIGGAILKRTRPLISVFNDSANSYASRESKLNPRSTFPVHEEESERWQEDRRGSNKRTPRIFTNIKKSLAGVRRWPSPSPTSATQPDLLRTMHTNVSNTRVLYSTPAERLGTRPYESPSYSPASTSPPTVAQIAMGLHTSRTPHTRSIRHPQPPGLVKRHTAPPTQPIHSVLKSSTTSIKEQESSSRLFSTHSNLSSLTTLSTPQSSSLRNGVFAKKTQKEGFFTKSKKVKTPFRHGSAESNASRKTVRFDDAASV